MAKWISVAKLQEIFAKVKAFTEVRYIKKTERVVFNLADGYQSIKTIQQVAANDSFSFHNKVGSIVTFRNANDDMEIWQLYQTPGTDYGNWQQQDAYSFKLEAYTKFVQPQMLDSYVKTTALNTTLGSYAKKNELPVIEELTDAEIEQAATAAFSD